MWKPDLKTHTHTYTHTHTHTHTCETGTLGGESQWSGMKGEGEGGVNVVTFSRLYENRIMKPTEVV
jgi:hypothetical protein